MRGNLDSLNSFKIMFQVPIFFGVSFPGKFFDSPGISEILLIYTSSVTQGHKNNRPR